MLFHEGNHQECWRADYRNCSKKETEVGFPDYIEKAETGAVGRALAMCGYGTLQAPEFDEGERIADAPIEKGNGN